MLRALPAFLLTAALLFGCLLLDDSEDNDSCPIPALALLDPDC